MGACVFINFKEIFVALFYGKLGLSNCVHFTFFPFMMNDPSPFVTKYISM